MADKTDDVRALSQVARKTPSDLPLDYHHIFLRLVEAIPRNSPLLTAEGILKSSYAGTKSLLDKGNLRRDVAQIACFASKPMTIYSREEAVHVSIDLDDLTKRLSVALGEEGEKHAESLRRFLTEMQDQYEAATGRVMDRESFMYFCEQQDISSYYAVYIKDVLNYADPDWIDPEKHLKKLFRAQSKMFKEAAVKMKAILEVQTEAQRPTIDISPMLPDREAKPTAPPESDLI